jgi:hypothetical protein
MIGNMHYIGSLSGKVLIKSWVQGGTNTASGVGEMFHNNPT